MTGAALRRFLHASTSSILLVGLWGDWETFRLAVHALLGMAVLGEGLRLWHAGFRSAIARAFPVFRPEESHRPSGAFWLVVGYAAASWVPFPGAPAGVLVAAFADPAASIVGTQWGRGRGRGRVRGGGGGTRKSWVGSVAAWAAAAAVLMSLKLPLNAALAGAFVAAVAERIPRPFDDNLVVAPAVAAVTWLLA